MICDKCNGHGLVDNPKYYDHGSAISYERGISPKKKCRKCKGSGYLIGNISEILAFLKHLEVKFEMDRDKEYLHQVKQCIKAIES